MKKGNETTRREPRSAKEIDYREISEIVNKAKDGDEIAQQEVSSMLKAIEETGLFERFQKMFGNQGATYSELIRDILDRYIEAFNNLQGTDLKTIDEIEEYSRIHGISPEDVDIESIVKKVTTNRPKNYCHVVGKLTDLVFENRITQEKGKKTKVVLDQKGKRGEVSVFASISWDEVMRCFGEDSENPILTEDGRQVLDGIHSNLLAGNHVMTYLMIYKGFTGDDKCRRLPQGIFEMISEALSSFRALLKIESNGTNDRVQRTFHDPILDFQQLEEREKITINGQEVTGGDGVINVLDFSVLYRFAKENGNEIDTRDIRLLNVPKINNTPENLRLKRYLYNRVIAMRNNYERKVLYAHKKMSISRNIAFSTILDKTKEKTGKKQSENTNEALLDNRERQRKHKIVNKTYAILDYWKEWGLISGYKKIKKPGTTGISGVEIDFIKTPSLPDNTDPKAIETKKQ